MTDATLALGIDLGTTNCALSSVAIGDKSATPTSPSLRPSLRVRPWQRSCSIVSLRKRGSRAHRRYLCAALVGIARRSHWHLRPARCSHTRPTHSSAKSWLSYSGVDRRSDILPWEAPGVPKMSPLAASARYLGHLKAAWDAANPRPRYGQGVVLTVPASFDALRELTVEAAAQIGLKTTYASWKSTSRALRLAGR